MADPLHETLTAALGAQYDVVRLIGRGGMGAVYLARERLLERPVAIKVLPLEHADADDARDRFLREARSAARLTHANVAPLYSLGAAGNTLFYIMGYVEGESLEARLRREGRLPFDETRRILSELAAALDHAHAHGIVHRDLKPDNVLIERGTGRAVLTDFGIAKQQAGGATLTRTGVIIGTPHYMSPEQAAGERDVDGRSDIYSLGVMAYRMLSGRLPFDGGSLQAVISQHFSQEPVPLSSVVTDLPPDLDAVVAKCLAKDPARRWQSAAMVRDALGSGDVTVALPDGLERFPGMLSRAVLGSYAVSLAGAVTWIGTHDPAWMWIAGFGCIGAVSSVAARAARGWRHGVSWRQLWRIALWPPAWWNFWWPARYRRTGDVWHRLPQAMRRARVVASAAVALLSVAFPVSVLVVAGVLSGATARSIAGPILMTAWSGVLAGIVAIGGSTAYALRWAKRHGLSKATAMRMWDGNTADARLWSRPEMAPLLSGAGRPALASAQPETPEAFVAALERMRNDVPDALRPLAGDAVSAARDLAEVVRGIDAELRGLARDADPAERDRLEQRLRALDASGGAEASAPAARQMRELVAGQLALMTQLADRARELAARRARALDLLTTLWLQLAALRAQPDAHAATVSELSARVSQIRRDASEVAIAHATLPYDTPASVATP